MKINKSANLPSMGREQGSRAPRKKYTIGLPLALASRLEALCEMHPQTTRTQLIGDLLGLGLAEVERARSSPNTPPTSQVPDMNQPIYLLTGPFSEFHHLSHQHHLALEHALNQEDAPALPPMDGYALDDHE